MLLPLMSSLGLYLMTLNDNIPAWFYNYFYNVFVESFGPLLVNLLIVIQVLLMFSSIAQILLPLVGKLLYVRYYP